MNIKPLIFLVAVMATAFIVSSCASKVTVAEFRQEPLDSKTASHQLPQYVIDKKKAKLAVLPPGDATQFRDVCGLAKSAHENLAQTLAKIGTVDVVERGQLDAFMQEMKFQAGITNEIDANKFMEIAKGIDYVFVGSISSASATCSRAENVDLLGTLLAKKGEGIKTEQVCRDQGRVLINYRVIEFPSGKVKHVFTLNGQKTINRNISYADMVMGCKLQDPCGILQEATYRAIDDAKESLTETFSTYGYIFKTITHKSNKKNRIAFLSLGKADGLEAGSAVDIIEFITEKDPIKGTESAVARVVAECIVTETELLNDRSICIISEENADSVFVKHAVRTKSETGVFRGMQKIYRKVF